MLDSDEQRAFQSSVAAVRQRVRPHLQHANSPAAALAVVVQLHRNLDKALALATHEPADSDLAVQCHSGCAHCCHLPVHATPAEVLLIAQHFKDGPPQRRLALNQALKTRAAAAAGETAGTGSRAAAETPQRQPCVFLVRGLCSIYELRPARCRKAHSLDKAACASAAPQIPQSLNHVLKAEALMQGAALAFADQGLATASVELSAGVLQALNDAAAAERWFERLV
jgi:uncharacterized protein